MEALIILSVAVALYAAFEWDKRCNEGYVAHQIKKFLDKI